MILQSTYGRLLLIRTVCLSSILMIMASVRMLAQDRPRYQMLRQEEDWSFLRDNSEQDYLDPIKFISLADNRQTYATLGGELRSYFKFYNREQLGAIPGQDIYLLQRLMGHVAVAREFAGRKIKARGFPSLKAVWLPGEMVRFHR